MDIESALLALAFFAFCGGLIDAAVGGGGLVQVPALLHALPQYTLATVFGTNKLAVLFLIPSGHVLWAIGGLVCLSNMTGAFVGTFLALRYGSGFIRVFFLILLVFLIGRMGLSIFA